MLSYARLELKASIRLPWLPYKELTASTFASRSKAFTHMALCISASRHSAGCSGEILFSAASSMASGHIQAQPNVIAKPATPDPEEFVPEPSKRLLISSTDAATAFCVILRAVKRQAELSDCASSICIAGGVGVTGVLAVLRSFHVPQRARLIWSVRKQGLVEGMVSEISQLSKITSVSVFEEKRMDIAAVLGEGLTGKRENGPVGVVVCGPPGVADEVRARISEEWSM
ncbi:hypothetical protein LA080_007749 [Diaporthe eres]|nr:hypothetical protein LA080_007749 [Diaporthe eres]